ncbi:DUF4870 domain-containing protein [Anoxynatronum buryatiense]|uniref:Uncharacterized membrane protein n=1 Tax=Anoxynatronum buryatiense TaxID=489973 RepID=A0AA45WVT3_9CLOT|nr:DUF4870 domain-containing protein [Anoxynatronum buryatiense]SMP55305.1 Uncharacterized membrane protein [Anoxynatronum buryatiense]
MNEESNNTTIMPKSSLGMDENVAALLAHVFGIVSGILFLVLEKESRFVKFHAMQAILLTIVSMVVYTVLGLIPVIGWIVGLFMPLVFLVAWIILLVKAYKHEWFKLPVIGDIAEKQAKV